MTHLPVSLALSLFLALPFQEAEVPSVRLPPGFEILPYADNSLAPDIYNLTISPTGKVIVASKGYTRVLIDRDGNGQAKAQTSFSSFPKDGATGMLVEKRDYFFTGDGGLWRQRLGADGMPDSGPAEKLLALQTGGEHSAHAVVRGPDNALYVLCGNNTGIRASHASDPRSPVRQPVGGAVLRYRLNTATCAIFADGFRNPYGMDFTPEGELFTFDSDNERCIALPWYEPTRFYHVVAGGRYGWWNPQRADAWRSPPWHADIIPPAATLGRGSPTGVHCYKGIHFPSKYRGGFFLLDWTFGKIWFCPLQPAGATWKSQPEEFLAPRGNSGFAPTGIAMHPLTGELFVSIGGRGTRGGVYKIRYRGAPLGQQPLQSFPPPLGDSKEWARLSLQGTPLQRRRALEFFAENTRDATEAQIVEALRKNLDHPDRFVRHAATLLAKELPPAKQETLSSPSPVAANTIGMALVASKPKATGQKAFQRALSPRIPLPVRLDALRLGQISLGEFPDSSNKGKIWEGYSLSSSLWHPDDSLLQQLRDAYPSGDDLFDLELERTYALLKDHDGSLGGRIALRLGSTEDPARDIHRLAALAEMQPPFSKDTRAAVVRAFLTLEDRFEELKQPRDRNWPLRVKEIFSVLSGKDANLSQAMGQDSSFGSPSHALFAGLLGPYRAAAAERLAGNMKAKPDLSWNAEAIHALEVLPGEKANPAWRALWGLHGLDALLARELARAPEMEDVEKFLSILERLTPEDLSPMVRALISLSPLKPEQLQKAARRIVLLPPGKEGEQPRILLFTLLRKNLEGAPKGEDMAKWRQWAEKNNAGLARALSAQGPGAIDWREKSREILWEKGAAQAGLRVFQSLGCAVCHGGSQALGPDLHGAAIRFSRDDLFNAILFPDRDVPARYRATAFTTHSGKTELGIIAYESADGVIYQNSKGETVRLPGKEIASKATTSRSLMPGGLLNSCPNDDFAHLYAYLKTLGPK
ncbi:MAG: hypothetical protein EXR99_16555 [Gemmataceae bacterium]|nr:hypothetical protein [Gemmataceae bacterium]